ncbi:MAG: DNA-directed RNA polymerase subunit beta [Verrucomicrobiota bacterium]|nr:DNA-directed RNA polymerase subunit beta [Verrucomicrobiota bacterium]MEC8656414.1 DNA-directed RNA polymerase subunit beta [Verrucomicrobiota bacterium]MEC8866583.1 DNA-directed RNA polymerase subunit beta [Verrucomicrobiota bacterium]|tara:strand:- start:11738 stop:15604 length:3867 start_codon:yes stop_codon:yes gene_type:complete
METTKRQNFGKLKEVIDPPNLIQNQVDSFHDFLQRDVPSTHRKQAGLEAVFREVFPILSYDEKSRLEYVSYSVGESKLSEMDCIDQNCTYAAPLQVKLRLRLELEGQSKPFYSEEEIFMGELPIVTERGSFIINGAERVVVSQLHRSPGVSFEESMHTSGKTLHGFRIIPDRGTWIEAQFDQHDLLYVYLDRRRRRRKFLITTFLRALLDWDPEKDKDSDQKIIELFYDIENLQIEDLLKKDNVSNYVLVEPMFDRTKGAVLAKAFEPLTKTYLRAFEKAGETQLRAIDTSVDDGAIIRCLKKDTTKNKEEALKEIYKKLRPGEPPDRANAEALIKRLFLDTKRYDLAKVGRHMLNLKLGLETPLDIRVTTVEDLVAATRKLTDLKRGKSNEEKAREDAGSIFDMGIDDIDHLGNRRVRTVGELLANVCRSGLSRTERVVRERMTLYDQGVESLTPGKLINPKALTTVVRDFFARSQLSQFKDQINPLAEMTHKRRLSALGPGGLNRERAGFEVRDVHPTHYGRICPIETPEGPNIGLINTLSTYAKIDEFGFLQSPYHPVEKGIVDKNPKNVKYLNAFEEERFLIAQANSEIDEKTGKLNGRVTCRYRDQVSEYDPKEVEYMDVSPKQVVSVAAGLIPFLEHDDANRALMGANMQRQAVPLLQAESPLVGTGIEKKVAEDSKTVTVSDSEGVVALADGKRIVVSDDGTLPPRFVKEPRSDHKRGIYCYELRKFLRSNAGTCFNQKPIVRKGDKVKVGQPLADGACTDDGELALGRNILVAFMPWKGYNFEDAILISEKMIKDDVYTSIHIEEFEVTARDTKLGPEEITRDIPNAGEEALRNLDHLGVVRIGAEVKPGDILVGKITPKSETDLAPEEKLLRAIFGEKAADVKDSSLKVPSGTQGIVMDIKVSSRTDAEQEKLSPSDFRRQMKQIKEDFRTQTEDLRAQLTESLSNILLGEKIPLNVTNSETGDIIIPSNRKITKTLLRRLASVHRFIEIPPSPVRIKVFEIIESYESKFNDLEDDRDRKIEAIEQGDPIDQGAIKNVRVFVAKKQKMRVGDKMAGRHGNKGVVAKIVAEEDMPFLPDGTPIEICLNPLGVPSRMNVGQVLETHLGWACNKLGLKVATPIFDGISEARIQEYLKEANLPDTGKTVLYDGCTGEPFYQRIVVGYMYMLKLNHLVSSKIHARAVGPYSLITQQPLGGKAQYGGQRFGEMEVWALEAYGAAYTLQEILTVKSDDVSGRTKIYESLVKGDNSLQAGTPQSFNVLMKEMQSLCLDIRVRGEDAL